MVHGLQMNVCVRNERSVHELFQRPGSSKRADDPRFISFRILSSSGHSHHDHTCSVALLKKKTANTSPRMRALIQNVHTAKANFQADTEWMGERHTYMYNTLLLQHMRSQFSPFSRSGRSTQTQRTENPYGKRIAAHQLRPDPKSALTNQSSSRIRSALWIFLSLVASHDSSPDLS